MTFPYQPDKHNGNYTCTVTNQYGSASHTASLFVNSPPQWIQRPEPSGEFRQGSMVKVLCSASGHPKPKIRWQKVSRTGERVDWPSADTSETTLTFVSVKREHEGDYVCTASNSLKELVAKFTLLVKGNQSINQIFGFDFHPQYSFSSAHGRSRRRSRKRFVPSFRSIGSTGKTRRNVEHSLPSFW